MEFDKLIEHRESVRDYNPDRPVDKKILLKILSAGQAAPSAANHQPWEFIVISSPEKLHDARKWYGKKWYKDAPHILVIKGYKDKAWTHPQSGYNSIETDLTIAMDHIILSAANEGVGTCWIIAFDPVLLSSTLDLKENEVVFAITPMGYARPGYERRAKTRKPLDEIAKFI